MRSLIVRSAMLVAALPAATARADLLLQFKFDEGTGGTAADTGTGTPAIGNLQNGAGWTTSTPNGASPSALDTYDPTAGSIRYVLAGDEAKLDGLSQFTLSIWVNFQGDIGTTNRRLMSKQNASTFEGFSWNLTNAGNADPRTSANFSSRLFVGGQNGFLFDPVPDATNNPGMIVDADKKWAFMAVTYDGTQAENNVKYYAGSESGAVTLLGTTTIAAGATLDSGALFGIGYTDAAPAATTVFLPGYVDDARVYNTVLSMGELDAVRLENLTAPPTLVGDTNDDGVVDLADLNNVLNNFGATGTSPGDDNGDGVVDLTDLNNVLNNFGATASASALSVVPEPASIGLLLLGAGTTLIRRRRI